MKGLTQQIESLSTIMKSVTVGSVKPKGREGISSPQKKEFFGNSPQKGLQGSPRKRKVSLKPGQKPTWCYNVRVGV